MKSPRKVADEFVDTITWPYSEMVSMHSTELADMLVAAIKADRQQVMAMLKDNSFEDDYGTPMILVTVEDALGELRVGLIEGDEPAPAALPTSSLSNRILDNYRHAEREMLPFTWPERWLENLRNPVPGAWYYATQAEVEHAIVVLDRLARVRRA